MNYQGEEAFDFREEIKEFIEGDFIKNANFSKITEG